LRYILININFYLQLKTKTFVSIKKYIYIIFIATFKKYFKLKNKNPKQTRIKICSFQQISGGLYFVVIPNTFLMIKLVKILEMTQ
jgi:hypothetical protein